MTKFSRMSCRAYLKLWHEKMERGLKYKKTRQILFVTRCDSIHAARWIMQLRKTDWDIHVFPATATVPLSHFNGMTLHDQWRCAIERTIYVEIRWPMHLRGMVRMRALLAQVARVFPGRAQRLARVIRKTKPDIVHSLEIQHAGYLTLEARRVLEGKFPRWIVQNWGSDIYLFQHLPGHGDRIRQVLEACDFYDCECKRDIILAKAQGFVGTALPVIPNGGGYDLPLAEKMRSSDPPSKRRVIMIKGYQGWAGRAHVAIAALYEVVDLLSEYTIRIYCARTEDVHIAAHVFSSKTGIPVEFIPPVSHAEMLQHHAQARISIGLSISDSISTSLLEAMLMGSFPVQSDTSVADDWIENGKSGIIVPPEDSCAVANALRKALTDDELVDHAATINAQMATTRLDSKVITDKVIAMYSDVFRMIQDSPMCHSE